MNFDQLESIKALIIDMDGVLWRGNEPIGDLVSIFEHIRSLGLKFIFATNNATRTVEEYHAKLNAFGVEIEDWQVINSSEATGLYLRDQYPNGVSAYVVGQPSLKRTLTNYDVTIVDETGQKVDVVVASLDYNLSYEKIKHASLLIQSGSRFIGTNPDVTLPTPEGFIPGSGTVIGAIEIASGKKADFIGKPQPLLYQMALKRLKTTPEETMAVGDRLETDIDGAQAAGIHSVLVLSGASTRVQANDRHIKPEIIVEDFSALLKLWKK